MTLLHGLRCDHCGESAPLSGPVPTWLQVSGYPGGQVGVLHFCAVRCLAAWADRQGRALRLPRVVEAGE